MPLLPLRNSTHETVSSSCLVVECNDESSNQLIKKESTSPLPTTARTKRSSLSASLMKQTSTLAAKQQDASHIIEEDEDQQAAAAILAANLAKADTRVVRCLRAAVLVVLLITAILVSTGVYKYTRHNEQSDFSRDFDSASTQLVQSFHSAMERHMSALASLSTSITTYATIQQQDGENATFPFLILPDFQVQGSQARIHSGAFSVSWYPLVSSENREEWEAFALKHRQQATEAYYEDLQLREEQDRQFELETSNVTEVKLQQAAKMAEEAGLLNVPGLTTLNDSTYYHPYIWSNGGKTPRGDEPPVVLGNNNNNNNTNAKYYTPLWQQSPTGSRVQGSLNNNLENTQYIVDNMIQTMLQEQKAVMNHAVQPSHPSLRLYHEYTLSLSQYRHAPNNMQELIDEWFTHLTYPVFDSFQDDKKQMVGVVSAGLLWKTLFSHILPSTINGMIAVVENSANQSFAYRINGPDATSIPIYDANLALIKDMELSTNINAHLEKMASPQNRAFKTVPLSDSNRYTLHIYPSHQLKDAYLTNQPIIYTVITLAAFCFASSLFLLYSYVVERRQHVMTAKVIESVQKAAQTERELNEFLSHEIRNPLSAAISACTFVSTAVHETKPLQDAETIQYARDDIEVVNASLHFINDFLRSMLDIYRAASNKITIDMAPTDILHDILEPVSNILYKRLSSFEVLVDCPPNLVIMTDSIRLKQVILNLVRNASKFVERGFLRMRAEVDATTGLVKICVEDSGPGISKEKQLELFSKYQESLDQLSQGTGIGLNLSKKLMKIMNGDLWLDDQYDSGIEGCPGACFVVDLNTPPVDLEATMNDKSHASNNQTPTLHDTSETSVQRGWTKPAKTVLPLKASDGNSTATINNQSGSKAKPAPDECEAKKLPEDIHVLFVDDDAMIRKLFIRALKRCAPSSWTIHEASSGEMALKLCESTTEPNLIFLDQYMASVDKQLLGTETAQAMRAKGVRSKIIGLSANDLRDTYINAGADEFILKPMPCKADELKRLLLKFLVNGPGPLVPPGKKDDCCVKRETSETITEGESTVLELK